MSGDESMARAVDDLARLGPRDFEGAHVEADRILLRVLRALGADDVANAYEAAAKRCGFVCA